MRVRVFDRVTEARTWGQPGGGHPIVVEVEIGDACPICGMVRGAPRAQRQYEDGEYYTVDVWDNRCGHVDYYAAVIVEARELREEYPDRPRSSWPAGYYPGTD